MDRGLTLEDLAPHRVAIRGSGKTWSDEDVHRAVDVHRPVLACLGTPGDLVVVPATDPVAVLAGVVAANLEGRVPVPVARASGFDLVAGVDGAPRRAPGAALVIRTSGSTGEPKFVTFARASVVRSAAKIAGYLGLAASDRVGIVQSLEHGYGLVGQLLSALAVGADVVWAAAPFFDEQAATLTTARTTVIAGVPYSLSQLARAGLAGTELRVIGSAGGPLGVAVGERLRSAFPGATIYNQYGCTEAGPRLTACGSDRPEFARGSVGAAIEGVSLKVDTDGEILFRADTEAMDYAGDPEATARARRDGWYRTGDLGRLEDGHLYVEGRTDEVVKVRGQKVSLAAVARAVEAAGARSAVAAVVSPDGADDVQIGVLYEGDGAVERLALTKRLPLESLPSKLVRVEALPRLPGGKIDRAASKSVLTGDPR